LQLAVEVLLFLSYTLFRALNLLAAIPELSFSLLLDSDSLFLGFE